MMMVSGEILEREKKTAKDSLCGQISILDMISGKESEGLELITKKNDKKAFITIDDVTGSLNVAVT